MAVEDIKPGDIIVARHVKQRRVHTRANVLAQVSAQEFCVKFLEFKDELVVVSSKDIISPLFTNGEAVAHVRELTKVHRFVSQADGIATLDNGDEVNIFDLRPTDFQSGESAWVQTEPGVYPKCVQIVKQATQISKKHSWVAKESGQKIGYDVFDTDHFQFRACPEKLLLQGDRCVFHVDKYFNCARGTIVEALDEDRIKVVRTRSANARFLSALWKTPRASSQNKKPVLLLMSTHSNDCAWKVSMGGMTSSGLPAVTLFMSRKFYRRILLFLPKFKQRRSTEKMLFIKFKKRSPQEKQTCHRLGCWRK
jgi:hypothetical protein